MRLFSTSEPETRSTVVLSSHHLMLLVDDSEADRFTFHRSMQTARVQTGDVIECETVFELYSNRVPVLILLNYSLPARNGLKLMQDLRKELGAYPPVVIPKISLMKEI